MFSDPSQNIKAFHLADPFRSGSFDTANTIDLPQDIEPSDTVIFRPWEAPLLLAFILVFCLSITLTALQQYNASVKSSDTSLSIRLQALGPKPIAEPVPNQLTEVAPSEAAEEITRAPQAVEKISAPTMKIEPSLRTEANTIHALSLDIPEEYLQAPQSEPDRYSEVFDSKLRAQLKDSRFDTARRQQQTRDLENYTSVYEEERFSTGNGKCFRVIDNLGEQMWVRSACAKKQKRWVFGKK